MRKKRPSRPGFLPDDTTPVTGSTAGSGILASLFWLIAFPATAYVLVSLYGLPGLKFQYTYQGPKDTRTETECLYLTFDGPQRVIPPVHQDRCPIIKLFPTKHIPTLF
ncbi:hypothetical protein [Rhizobium sp. RU36D]|uniref:hypothetical protein n=1 Tax=Rhizobium sp. RU36D TaxID=1907415 RepID=UPI0009D87FE6|nr:hypothetical protein [Rhizobium sp. RU36D]SMD14975.1 hypothetical protein SAMN05880593_1276 [Rhizobium sp. RU36D]